VKLLRNLLLPLLLALVLSLPALAGEEPAFDGYIIKLSDHAPALFSAGGSGLLAVDTLAEAEELPAEWVEYIEPNYRLTLFDTEDPVDLSDPYAADQWWMAAIEASAAREAGLTGAGVTVGFVDSGIRATHEDLDGTKISGMNFYSGDNWAYTSDSTGHGTFCAGILAAQPENGKGLSGLAPGVNIRMYRAFYNDSGSVLDVALAIRQAVDDGCQVLNLSFGIADSRLESFADSKTLKAAIQYALDGQVIVVAAVGNDSNSVVMYPAAHEGVIGVGSVGPGLTHSGFSHYNSTVFVSAPGGKMISLGYTSDDSYRLNPDATKNSGTSYAAPVVSALAALALEADPDLTPEQFCDLLKETATDQGAEGYDVYYGWGTVNVARFVEKLKPSLTIKEEGTVRCVTQEDSILLIGIYSPEGKLEKLEYRTITPGVHTLEYDPSEGEVRIFLLEQTTLSPLCSHLIP